ncbi:MAG: hypothetical protein ABI610_01485 [Acidobacteriota bacterium]
MRAGRLVLVFLVAAVAPLSAADGVFEKTIPVPRDSDARLDWKHRGCSVHSLTLRNYPDEEDIEEARRKDKGDKTWLWWEFNVSNSGDQKCRIGLVIEVLDRRGRVVKSSDRSDSVSPGELDDDIRLSTLMKTLDIVDAAKVRLRATIR